MELVRLAAKRPLGSTIQGRADSSTSLKPESGFHGFTCHSCARPRLSRKLAYRPLSLKDASAKSAKAFGGSSTDPAATSSIQLLPNKGLTWFSYHTPVASTR